MIQPFLSFPYGTFLLKLCINKSNIIVESRGIARPLISAHNMDEDLSMHSDMGNIYIQVRF